MWEFKGYYIYSNGIKKVFNGSEIKIILNVLSRGVILSIAMEDNRRNQESYSREKIIESLKGYRLIPSSEKIEQPFDWEVIIAKWDYTEFNPQEIAKIVDKYIDRIRKIDFRRD